MAYRNKDFDEPILKQAEAEFLENNYNDVSLRTIAKKAGVSTSTFYTRYGDKEGLFRFLVEPVIEDLLKLLSNKFAAFDTLSGQEKAEQHTDYSGDGISNLINFIYDHFNIFKILIMNSPGNMYQDFIEKLVELDVNCMKGFLQDTGNVAYKEGRITEGFMHVVSTGYYSGIFEIVIHDMPKEEAISYIKELSYFYSNGWNAYF